MRGKGREDGFSLRGNRNVSRSCGGWGGEVHSREIRGRGGALERNTGAGRCTREKYGSGEMRSREVRSAEVRDGDEREVWGEVMVELER